MRLAFIADWLPTYAGAERVIAQWCSLWPDAPLFTTVAQHGKLGPLDRADIRASALQRWYRILGNHKLLLPWMPRAIERIDLRGYDIVLSSSHAVAKGVIPPSTAIHICYCHTPMRYAWEMEEQYLQDFRVPALLRKTVRRRLTALRRWDMTTAKRTDVFIANSSTTQERIARTYARESTVIHPPVDDHFFEAPLHHGKRTSYLAVGRLVPYKRFDLLIQAANAFGFPLDIAGTGQDEQRLRSLAGPTVRMLGYVPEEQLSALYAQARALLFPPFEDAGVVPLEAQACGTPVIAYGQGGALDTVLDGVTGLFFAQQTIRSLHNALQRFDTLHFDPEQIRAHAQQFSGEIFRGRMRAMVDEIWQTKLANKHTGEFGH
ncbi:glycosyltransferase family 4 protein [Candidatus Peribacteria bacterium]|nr:glycosyltransferase family 4 protein [Candidatus Peribacteria bacterium]